MAASFVNECKSAPENPGVLSAMTSKLTSSANVLLRVCTFKISNLSCLSGKSIDTLLSNRPGRRSAGSSTSGLGVRQIYETLFGVQGNIVKPELALFPKGKPPIKLPRISPAKKPAASILNPEQAKKEILVTKP